jgi:arylsulfatase A-like enzyme
VAAAAIAAAWQVAAVAWRVVAQREIAHVSRDFVWMVSAATLCMWLVLAMPSGVFARLLPRVWALRLATAGFFSLTAISILLPITQLARFAVAIFALGAGFALAGLVVDRPALWLRRSRRLAAVLLALLGTLAAGIAGRDAVVRRQRLASLRTPTPGAPNILLIVLDAARADALSSYGYERPTTPHIDALAREGVLFETAIATAPWTLPSHVTLLSGRYQFADGSGSAFLRLPMEDDFPVIAEAFGAMGYESAGFVANFFFTGWDTQLDRGFIRYRDHPRTFEQTLRSSTFGQTAMARGLYGNRSPDSIRRVIARSDFTVPPQAHHAAKNAAQVTDEFLQWMETRAPRPFFAFLNYYDAHKPYQSPPPFNTRFSGKPGDRDRYDGALAFADAEVGRLLRALKERNALDSTLVIVTSDHGELFGEHGFYEHTSNLYYSLLRVPLILRWPGHVPAGRRIATAVSIRDVSATIAGLLGSPELAGFPGTSLSAHWSDSGARGSPVFAAVEKGVRSDTALPFTKGDMVTLFDDEWHYIRNNGLKKEELYRFREDPEELVNLVDRPEADSVVRRFREGIAVLRASGPSGPASVLYDMGWRLARPPNTVGRKETVRRIGAGEIPRAGRVSMFPHN